jgi:integrase
VQSGTIIRHRASWTLVYYDMQFREGKRKRIRVWKKLARVSKEYPTAQSCRLLAAEFLAPLNRQESLPETSLPFSEFIDKFYFPAQTELKPSTLLGYKSIYSSHLKNKPELKIRVRDFRTVHAQRLLHGIPNVGHLTLLHIKNFLSGVFRWAKQEGFYDGMNPVIDAKTLGRPTKRETVAYGIDDVSGMLERLDYDVDACEVIALLSLTGLRQSEIRGLRWSDWDEKEALLNIARAVWRTHVGRTKNVASEASIPVISLVQELLQRRRERVKPREGDYIFAGPRKGAPLDLHNMQNRVIKPALKDSPIEWKGFHGFRRGLATNLLALEVPPAVIAKIMRHSNPSITLAFYAKSKESESRKALERLENQIRNMPSLIAESRPD